MFDVAIVGCGVVGALTARALTRYNLSVCVLEANSDVAMGASAANSGIVHAGFDAPVGSLKAKYNVLGNAAMPLVCSQLGVEYKNNGALVVGFSESDMQTLAELRDRGLANGVGGLEIVDGDALRVLEPNIGKEAVGALLAKTSGIVSPYGLAIAAIGNAMDNGAVLKTCFKVAEISKGDCFTLRSDSNLEVCARYIVNCAGAYADDVAKLVGDNSVEIRGRKGEYILLDRVDVVSHTLFTCPSDKGKGVLVSPTVHGNLFLGPTSVEVDNKEDNSTSADGFALVVERGRQLCGSIPLHSTITSFCGVRAYSAGHDFVLGESSVSGFINAAGIESPGLTASPAIADHICALIVHRLGANANPHFNGCRTPFSFFKDMSAEEKNRLIGKSPDFGEIVCRCEQVSLGEIMFELNRNPVPTTVDGIKRRVRAGMGRCQGGFCQPYVVEILAKSLGVRCEDVTKCGGESYLFSGRTK